MGSHLNGEELEVGWQTLFGLYVAEFGEYLQRKIDDIDSSKHKKR